MDIQITEAERAQNVAFQIKQLIVQLNQMKPNIMAALSVMKSGADGVSLSALKKALGDSREELTKKLEAVNEAI